MTAQRRRCKYCGEMWHSTIAQGEQYVCGTIVCGDTLKRHRYCMRLCGETGNRRVKPPRMKVDAPPKPPKMIVGRLKRWRHVREVLLGMSLGQTVRFDGIKATSAQDCCRYFSSEIPHKVMFRSEGTGCVASMVGDISNMEPGESRPYTDNLRHLMRRLLTLNTPALCGRSEQAYSFDLIENVFWIRRVQ